MKKMLKVNMLRLLLGMSTLVFLGISGSFTAYAGDTPAAPQQHKRVMQSFRCLLSDIKARKWY